MDKLESMDQRLRKLDNIETRVTRIDEKVGSLDRRISSLESDLNEQRRKLNEIEASRNYDSNFCDTLKQKQDQIDKTIRESKIQNDSVCKNYETLKYENQRLNDEVVDLQARSMRDNLLFFGFPEENTIEERRLENCSSKLIEFFKTKLQINNAPETIKLDRAHRLGKHTAGKNRPIVAKFNFYPDKLFIKQSMYDKMKGTDYRVSDQFPKAIQERRRQLVPELMKARRDGLDAIISYDRIVIKGRRSTQGTSAVNPDGTNG
jgi:hypothetical protein